MPSRRATEQHQEVVDLWKTTAGADWSYYEAAESDEWSGPFWDPDGIFYTLFKRLDLTRTLEIAAGLGRHAARIVNEAKELVLTDSSIDALQAARERFKDQAHVSTVLSVDGLTIPDQEDASFTSVYSYDAMVHFELETVASYLAEAERLLVPGGHALFHHSNLSQKPGGVLLDNPGWRNYMTTALFTHLARRRGLEVVEQHVLDWAIPGSDALSLLRKPA
jgi:SAM-dependent methyltransferase